MTKRLLFLSFNCLAYMALSLSCVAMERANQPAESHMRIVFPKRLVYRNALQISDDEISVVHDCACGVSTTNWGVVEDLGTGGGGSIGKLYPGNDENDAAICVFLANDQQPQEEEVESAVGALVNHHLKEVILTGYEKDAFFAAKIAAELYTRYSLDPNQVKLMAFCTTSEENLAEQLEEIPLSCRLNFLPDSSDIDFNESPMIEIPVSTCSSTTFLKKVAKGLAWGVGAGLVTAGVMWVTKKIVAWSGVDVARKVSELQTELDAIQQVRLRCEMSRRNAEVRRDVLYSVVPATAPSTRRGSALLDGLVLGGGVLAVIHHYCKEEKNPPREPNNRRAGTEENHLRLPKEQVILAYRKARRNACSVISESDLRHVGVADDSDTW